MKPPVMKYRILSFLLGAVISTSTHAQLDTVRWIVLSGETEAGFLKKWVTPDGVSHEWFQYNDRGRGDSTVCHYREDPNGFLVWLDAAGKDYLKKPIFEKFSLTDGIASWENNIEKGQLELKTKALYIPLKVSCGTTLKLFMTSPDSTIALLPSGNQRLKILDHYNLASGEKLLLYQLSGGGFGVSHGWMNDKFENVANVSEWLTTIPKELEAHVPALMQIQKRHGKRYFTDVKKRVAQPYTKLAITHAKVFDPVKKTAVSNQTITIENGTITNVTDNPQKLSRDYTIIDASGKFVMPGLWDMHVHYSGGFQGPLMLACGVTNVRDMGGFDILLQTRKDIDEGKVLGPRIQMMSGFIDAAGPFAGPVGTKISSVEEGIAAIRKYASNGYQQIKLYSSLNPEWVKSLAAEAKKHNMRVSGHIPAHMLASEAIDAGFDEINHMNMIFLNFYGKDIDTRTTLRFTTVAQKAAFFNFENQEFKDFVELLKRKQIAVDPTTVVFERLFTQEDGKPTPALAPVIDRLPLSAQRDLKSSRGLKPPNGLADTYRKSFNNVLQMVKVLYDAGVPIIAGTDDTFAFAMHRELENYVYVGIPPAEVLAMATMTAATVAKQNHRFGSIEKNKAADILIIDGDPLKNISDIRKASIVIKDNEIYETKRLYESIFIKPN
jgi:hypothetical protein